MKNSHGYILLVLILAVFVLGLGLLVAIPVWQTQIQRENEEELISRGNQYLEAIRLFQMKNPGGFSKSLEELYKKRCLRRLYKDPMTKDGKWNVILPYEGGLGAGSQKGDPQKEKSSGEKILVMPEDKLSSIQNPRIMGVVSSSTKKSFRIYNGYDSYDKWLFFYGADPASSSIPEIVYYGQSQKK